MKGKKPAARTPGQRLIDMAGRKCGRLTVIDRAPDRGDHCAWWRCKCACGAECVRDGGNLRRPGDHCCTECQREISAEIGRAVGPITGPNNRGRLATLIDLTGQRFSRLLVIGRADPRPGDDSAYWRCKCDCGSETIVRGKHLRAGRAVSCGCARRDPLVRKLAAAKVGKKARKARAKAGAAARWS